MISSTTQLCQLKSKKMGILLLDARQTSKKTIDECAKILNISSEQYKSYESGEKCPSLPEIEMLAYIYGVPVNHFFGQKTLSQENRKSEKQPTYDLLQLRNKMISIQLKMARTKGNLSISDVSARTAISEAHLQAYESGSPVPMAELHILAELYGKNVNELIDQKGTIGVWNRERTTFEKYQELPASIQQFISKPINLPYLELAEKLSRMPAEDLRAIAENILQITL